MTAELSVYLHFVWHPWVRCQGYFKRYFRPNGDDDKSVISTVILANEYEMYSGKNNTKKGRNSHFLDESTPFTICLYTPGSQKDPYIHVIHLVIFLTHICVGLVFSGVSQYFFKIVNFCTKGRV